MTEHTWRPIDTMPLSRVGTKVDLREGDLALTSVTVDRIATATWSLMDDVWPDAPQHLKDAERFAAFITTLERGKVQFERHAEWRPAK